MSRACWSILTEVEGVAHTHELQAGCCIQVAQQAVVRLMRYWWLADGAWCSAPQACVLQQAGIPALGHEYRAKACCCSVHGDVRTNFASRQIVQTSQPPANSCISIVPGTRVLLTICVIRPLSVHVMMKRSTKSQCPCKPWSCHCKVAVWMVLMAAECCKCKLLTDVNDLAV